ncbi:N-acetyltransferase [Dinoroseobacter phage vB_DshS-R5C]|uniref:N-acetyltransferase n=1 Tax=Dinoroseobacter phage vB_DshS-R5C TaxID=1965368 RepID=A0A1V0DY99_9CAUD|nr:N-acetyltransferase [Dinoroseobacter phage vB_DshS-R5C]ARB06142.1 N-acetyltransferase [Dinoroseobacter phage vB_DshS-R5C]
MLLAMREAAEAGHLKIVDGGLLEFKPRRDGQLTIYTIVATKPGVGSQLFKWLLDYCREHRVQFIQAKCPVDLPSNAWYEKKGFELACVEKTKRSGRELNVWRYPLTRRELF